MPKQLAESPFETERSRQVSARERLILELPDGNDPWLYDENHRLVKASELAKRYRREEMTKQAWHGKRSKR